MRDTITFDPNTGRVIVQKPKGQTFVICSYDNAHRSHRRGAFVLGDHGSRFRLSKDTTARVLKHFYPDSLSYLKKHGYIAS